MDRVSFAVWQLCDGGRDLEQIRAEMAPHFERPPTLQDVSETVKLLEDNKLVSTASTARYPLIRVRFEGEHGPGDPLNDYLSWVLTRRINIVIVDEERADVVFVFGPGAGTQRIDSDGIQVLVCTDDTEPDLDSFDFVFGYRRVENRIVDRYARMPPGARRSSQNDWTAQDDLLTAGYRAERLSGRLYDYLFDPPKPPSSASRNSSVKLTIGMATYDDFDGTFFSAQAIRLYHPEVTADTEILVIDNNPRGDAGASLRMLEGGIAGYRYVPWGWINSTSVRDIVFQQARGEWVLCMDCHVFLEPGALKRLIDYIDANPNDSDLLQGPLINNRLSLQGTHFTPRWRAGMYGVWGIDARAEDHEAEPFEIPMQGLGLFACRKDAWLGFNPRFRGFGGEEGYIHAKFRRAGRRTLCLPFLRWLHRFQRPRGVPYPNLWDDRIRNYLIGADELGLETGPIEEHFSEFLSKAKVDQVWRDLRRERANPYSYFDTIFCINLDREQQRWEEVSRRFERIGIGDRVHRVSAVETPESHHIGCALTHRLIIDHARRRGLERILVFEDDVIFLDGGNHYLRQNIEELDKIPWRMLYLGGNRRRRRLDAAHGCKHLRMLGDSTTGTHGIAYHFRVYDALLRELPDNERDMTEWVKNNRAIDKCLRNFDDRYLVNPAITSQPSILDQEDAILRDSYW
jgi:hypothetical protein